MLCVILSALVILLNAVPTSQIQVRNRAFTRSQSGTQVLAIVRQGGTWTSSSVVSCAMTCLATFEDCYSFLYQNATKTCTPGSAFSFSEQPPSPAEGILYLAKACDQSQEFVNLWISAGTTICVYVSETTARYHDAKNICQDKGGHLYGAQTLPKYQLFLDIVAVHPGDYMLGLTDVAQEGTWTWDADGTEMSSEMRETIFFANEPNGATSHEDCAFTKKQYTKTLFFDVACNTHAKFICEKHHM
ncbi:uncharacterized protein LOC101850724 [Aplysia californica]|uniref:Uncharacterized protein LOC101850724 n=1 Tax=Aplysia californica TaxID=6500 RepID=A0ABM0JRK3_APLCA|nr:uncharacterized protein LOC101850724 [Aplysia californica]